MSLQEHRARSKAVRELTITEKKYPYFDFFYWLCAIKLFLTLSNCVNKFSPWWAISKPDLSNGAPVAITTEPIYLAAGHSLIFPKPVSQEDDQKPENTQTWNQSVSESTATLVLFGRVKTCFPPPKLQQPSHAGLWYPLHVRLWIERCNLISSAY